MRRATLLLATTISILAPTLTGTLPGTAAASWSAKSARPQAPRGDSGKHRARTVCRRRRLGVCQATARGERRGNSARRRGEGPRASAPRRTIGPNVAGARMRAAQIAAVLATPCENTGLTPEPSNLGLVRAAVVCLVNHVRAQNGETPLRLSAPLTAAAEGHSRELVSVNYFAHVSPAGETPVGRIREMGYIPGPSVGYVIGENLAWGTYSLSTPAAIVAAWVASPGHLANILESQYSETGVGVTPQVPSALAGGAAGATYAQEFGVILP